MESPTTRFLDSGIAGSRRGTASDILEDAQNTRSENSGPHPIKWARPRDASTARERALTTFLPLLPESHRVVDYLPIAGSTTERVNAVIHGRKTVPQPSPLVTQDSSLKWQGARQTRRYLQDAATHGVNEQVSVEQRASAPSSTTWMVGSASSALQSTPATATAAPPQPMHSPQPTWLPPTSRSPTPSRAPSPTHSNSAVAERPDPLALELAQTLALPVPPPVDVLEILHRATQAAQAQAPAHNQAQAQVSVPYQVSLSGLTTNASLDAKPVSPSQAQRGDQTSMLKILGAAPSDRLQLNQYLIDRTILLASQHFRAARQPPPNPNVNTAAGTSTPRNTPTPSVTPDVSKTSARLGVSMPLPEPLAQYYCSNDIARTLTAFRTEIEDEARYRTSMARNIPGSENATTRLTDAQLQTIAPTTQEIVIAGARLQNENAILTSVEMQKAQLQSDIQWLKTTPLLIEVDEMSLPGVDLSDSSENQLPTLGELARFGSYRRATLDCSMDATKARQEVDSNDVRERILESLKKRDKLRTIDQKVVKRVAAAVSRYAARFVFALSKKHSATMQKRLTVCTGLHKRHRLVHLLNDISMGLTDEAIRNALHAVYSQNSASQQQKSNGDSGESNDSAISESARSERSSTPSNSANPQGLTSGVQQSTSSKVPSPAATALVAALGGEAFIRERAIAAGLLLPNGQAATPENTEHFRQQQMMKEQMQQHTPYLSRRSAPPPPPPPLPLHHFPIRFYLELAQEFPPFPLALALGHDALHPSKLRNVKQRLGAALVATLIPSTISYQLPPLSPHSQYPVIPPMLSQQQLEQLSNIEPNDVVTGAQALAAHALTPQPLPRAKPQPVMGPQALQAAQQALNQYQTAVARRQAQMVAALPNEALANPYMSPLFAYLSPTSKNLAGAHFRLATLAAITAKGVIPTPGAMREKAGLQYDDGGFAKYNYTWQPSVETLTVRFQVMISKANAGRVLSSSIEKTTNSFALDESSGGSMVIHTFSKGRLHTVADLLFELRDRIDGKWLQVIHKHAQASVTMLRDRWMSEKTSPAVREPVKLMLAEIGNLLHEIRRDIRAYDGLLQLVLSACGELGLVPGSVAENEPATKVTSSQELIWGVPASVLGPPTKRRGRPSQSIASDRAKAISELSRRRSTISASPGLRDPDDPTGSPRSSIVLASPHSTTSRPSFTIPEAEMDESSPSTQQTRKDSVASLARTGLQNDQGELDIDEEELDEDEDDEPSSEADDLGGDAEYSDDCDTADATEVHVAVEARKSLRARAARNMLTREDIQDVSEVERLLLLRSDRASAWFSRKAQTRSKLSGNFSRLRIQADDLDASSTSDDEQDMEDEDWTRRRHTSEANTPGHDTPNNLPGESSPSTGSTLTDKLDAALPKVHHLPDLQKPRVFSLQLVWLASVLASRKYSLPRMCIIHALWPDRSEMYSSEDQLNQAGTEPEEKTTEPLTNTDPGEAEGKVSETSSPLTLDVGEQSDPEEPLSEPLQQPTMTSAVEPKERSEEYRMLARRHRRLARRYLAAVRHRLVREIHEAKIALHALSEQNYSKWKAEGVARAQRKESELASLTSGLQAHEGHLDPMVPLLRKYARARSLALLEVFSKIASPSETSSEGSLRFSFQDVNYLQAKHRVESLLAGVRTPVSHEPAGEAESSPTMTPSVAPASPVLSPSGTSLAGDDATNRFHESIDDDTPSDSAKISQAYFDVERLSLLTEEVDECLAAVLNKYNL